MKKREVVSARTLRRHWDLLSNIGEKVLTIGYSLQDHKNQAATRHNRMVDRLERLESHVVVLVGHVERLVREKETLEHTLERQDLAHLAGILARGGRTHPRTLREVPPLSSGWTRANEAALIRGLSDAALKRAAVEAQS